MIGSQILNYRIERLIGEGGMGNVYLAAHAHIGRKVAIKALNPSLAKNPEIRERFKNEASMLSQLHHPNIVQLYDYVEMDNGVFLVMEFADGQPLDEYIEKVTGPIPEEKALQIFNKILDGVLYAHKKNVVHRDIKPSNIMVNSEGMVKILDFGIAKIIGDTNNKLTKTGTKLGTVLYMSPEQVKGQDIDLRTDIYSLGITLFEMLTGKCPYDGSTSEYEVYKKIVEEELPDPRSFYPGVSEHLVSIIGQATRKDPLERFDSCLAFRQAIQEKKAVVADPKEKKASKSAVVTRKGSFMEGSMLFWNVFLPMLIATFIVLAALRLMTVTDEKFIVANKVFLRTTRSVENDSNKIKLLEFGDKVEVLGVDREVEGNGYRWVRVKDAMGTEGYMAVIYLGSTRELRDFREIFGPVSLENTDAIFKKAVREHYIESDFFDEDGVSLWHVYGEKGNPAYNDFLSADFNADSIPDYACVLSNTSQDRYQLLAFLGSYDELPIKVLDVYTADASLLHFKISGGQIQIVVRRKSDNVESRFIWNSESQVFVLERNTK